MESLSELTLPLQVHFNGTKFVGFFETILIQIQIQSTFYHDI